MGTQTHRGRNLNEVARIGNAEELKAAVAGLGDVACIQLEKPKYERISREKLEIKVRPYYETDGTLSVFISHFIQQLMAKMLNAIEAQEQGIESWFLFHFKWTDCMRAKVVQWTNSINEKHPVRVLMLETSACTCHGGVCWHQTTSKRNHLLLRLKISFPLLLCIPRLQSVNNISVIAVA